MKHSKVEFKELKNKEIKPIETLLMNNDLPYNDLVSSNVDFMVAKIDNELIGCIGIEKYGENGLLRSFAVSDRFKNNGVGSKLLKLLLQKSKEENIKTIHLLTTTADGYFTKKGFNILDRTHVPQKIANTTEFSGICPTSAIYMRLQLE